MTIGHHYALSPSDGFAYELLSATTPDVAARISHHLFTTQLVQVYVLQQLQRRQLLLQQQRRQQRQLQLLPLLRLLPLQLQQRLRQKG